MTRQLIARSDESWSKLPRRKQLEFKLSLMERDGLKCLLCGNGFRFGQLTIDHVLPVSRGGPVSDIRNMRLLCKRCHKERHKEHDLVPKSRRRSGLIHRKIAQAPITHR